MKRLNLLLILAIAVSLMLPLNMPVQAEGTLAIGTKVVLDNEVVATYLGKTPEGDNIWQAVISAPMYLDDLQTPIDASWDYDSGKNEWNAKANLFTALVKGAKVTVWYEGQSLSWQPDVFIGTKKQAVGTEQLIIYDPINENYIGNTLQWHYGEINRSVRIIEGMLQEYYTIAEHPGEDVMIISHSEKDAGFVWTRPSTAWDANHELVELIVDGDDLTLTVAAMANATFPITIDPDTTFAGTYKDGYVRTDLYRGDSWNNARNTAYGDTVQYGATASSSAMRTAYNGGFAITRSFFYFDTSSLPDGCTVTVATFRLRGYNQYDTSVSVQRGTQAATLGIADFDNFAGNKYAHQSWGSGYKTFAITTGDISKTGTTKFCAREYTYDYQNNEPPESVVYYDDGCYYYEQGAGYYPELVITFVASAAPTITTNNATYVTATTAQLNSYLVDDGGDYCDVRFQYGNSTGNYTVNTTWVNDTYITGDSPYVEISNLTVSTEYFFRVQAANSQGSVNGSELTFTTGSGVEAPTNLTAYPSSHSVSLAWVKGINTTNTMIRGQVGAYPVNYTDGDQVYFDDMSTATHSGLSPGTTWYYRAFGESGGNFTANYTEVVTTTSAGAAAPGDPDAPDMPSAWYGSPDHTRLSGVPFYGMVNDMAENYGMPPTNFWLLLMLFGASLMGLFFYRVSHSGTVAIIGSGVTLVIMLQSLGGLLWIVFAVGMIATGIFVQVRRA